MRILIDGYNVMFAAGLLGRRLGPDGFRQVRHRFLNQLAASLEPLDVPQTTVVFDAHDPPADRPSQATHKGITVVFAVADDDADGRIEALIAQHSAPKGLTVVSTDGRIREAARRRKAKPLTADEFLDGLGRRRRERQAAAPPPPTDEDRDRQLGPTTQEAARWLAEFADLDADPAVRDALRPRLDFAPTDADLDQIRREVGSETAWTPARRRRPLG